MRMDLLKKLVSAMMLFFVFKIAAAQSVVTCSSSVPKDVCAHVSQDFLIPTINTRILILDSAAFKAEKANRLTQRVPGRYGDQIIFIQEQGYSCPNMVLVSSDTFRPRDVSNDLKITCKEGYDQKIGFARSMYIAGYLEGCACTRGGCGNNPLMNIR